MKASVSHTDYQYPTQQQALDAGRGLYLQLTGAEPRDVGCIVQCAYTVVGFGLSFVPDDHPSFQAAASGEEAEKELATQLEPLAKSEGEGEATPSGAGINWGQIAALALQVLLQILRG